jgi:hypothetical protein
MPLPDLSLTGRWCDQGESHDSLDYSELPSDSFESGNRFVDVGTRMGRAELATNACLPMRDHWKPESRYKDAFLQQQVTHSNRRGGLPHDYRHNRRFAG